MYTVRWEMYVGQWKEEQCTSLEDALQWCEMCADFGIAHSLGSTRLTATQTVMGTAGYLSPEQAAGAAVSPASDIYSLGLVVLECFTGHMEYPGTAAESLAARIGRDPVLPPSLPAGWSAFLARMLARDPSVRPTALEVARESASIAPELEGIHPSSNSESSEPAKTRVMPVPTAVLAPSRTAPTLVVADRAAAAASKPRGSSAARRRVPILIASIVLGTVLLVALLIVITRPVSKPTPTPPISVSSSTPSPIQPTPAATLAPPPGKGKGHGHGKNH